MVLPFSWALQVSNCTISLPGQQAVSIALYSPATTTGASTTTASGTSATLTAAITVVNIQAAELEVVVTSSTAVPTSTVPVDISKVVDTTPPVISLAGGTYVPVLQLDRFIDPGVRAYDDVDGNSVSVVSRLQLCARPSGDLQSIRANDTRALAGCGAQLASINSTTPSRDNETFVVTYSARDSVGNQAAPMRRYITVTARCVPRSTAQHSCCSMPVSCILLVLSRMYAPVTCGLTASLCNRCAALERWCPELSACSVQGLCLRPLAGTGTTTAAGTSAASPTATSTPVRTYVPPPDKTPPKLVMLGSGRPALTATGAAVLMVDVTWKSVWQDPGATAVDAVDGDLSSSIQSFGAGAVDTSIPTAPGKDFGFVVEYYVEDRSKNAAPVARRLIRIVCPGSERYCSDPETGKPTCTSKGICGASALLSIPSSSAAASGGVASASRAASSPAAAVPTPPSISLLAPGAVQITAGAVYDRCAESAAINEVCERGATAEDAKDGNLDRQVLVCGNR